VNLDVRKARFKPNATKDSAQTLCNVVPIVAKRMRTRLRQPQCRSLLSSDRQDTAANEFLVRQNAQLATLAASLAVDFNQYQNLDPEQGFIASRTYRARAYVVNRRHSSVVHNDVV
jgi:hypothetical protein